MKIKITKNTVIAGVGRVYVGELHDVDMRTARELLYLGKAVPAGKQVKKEPVK